MSARIDAHQHFWTLARGDYGWLTPALGAIYRDFTPTDLAPLGAQAGIDATVLVQAAPTSEETDFLLEIAARTPWVAGVVGWVDMRADDAPEQIATLAATSAAKGIRPMIQDLADDDWVLDPRLDPAFDALIANDLTFDALVLPRHLRRLLRRLERHPELRCVIDHGAKPEIAAGKFDRWAADIADIAETTGACCKLSGLVGEAGPGWTVARLRPYADHLLDRFGPDRLMFGSDWPVVNLVADYDTWFTAATTLTAALTADERAAVFGDTARRFYRLTLPTASADIHRSWRE